MNSHYQVLRDVCASLKHFNDDLSIIVYFYSKTFDFTRQIEDAKKTGFLIHLDDETNPVAEINEDYFKINRDLLGGITDFFPDEFKIEIRKTQKILIRMLYSLKLLTPDLVLVSDNTICHNIPCFIKTCKIVNKPVINIPFGLHQPLYNQKMTLGTSEPILDEIVTKKFPRYILNSEGKSYLPLSAAQIVSFEYLGVEIPRPWAWNANDIDKIIVDSEYSHRLNLEQSVPSKSLTRIQSLINRNICKSKAILTIPKSIKGELELPIVLINAPAPLQGLMEIPECSFEDPKEMISAFLKFPSDILDKAHFVWCVHPRLKKEDYSYVQTWGVHIVDAPAVDLLPVCDVFVGSDSTLFKTALLLKKPVVNFQIRNDVSLFRYVGGCIDIMDKFSYHKTIVKLTCDNEYYNKVIGQIDSDLFGYVSEYLPTVYDILHKTLHSEYVPISFKEKA